MAQSNTTVKSAYRTYCELKGVEAIAFYADARLVAITKDAAKENNQKHTEWLRDALITAVRADGFDYTVETKASLQDEVAALRAELAALKAKDATEEAGA